MDCYTLFEFNQFIKRFVALNVPEAVWITAEISQSNLAKGHNYIDLIQKSEETEEILAFSSAVLWRKDRATIQTKKKTSLDEILTDGMQVKLKVQLNFHERYGMKLIINDLDENYTFGKLAIQKTEVIKRLKKEKLFSRNSLLSLPTPILKIAVMSSVTAAGYKDFITHLKSNEFGYTFETRLFTTSVQGLGMEQGFSDAFDDLKSFDDFDCIVVIRGGGSKLDLSGFDSYEICKQVALSELPVLAGIGHEIDETVFDLVAHTSLKTPTAVADFIINRNLEYEMQLNELASNLSSKVSLITRQHETSLESIQASLSHLARNVCQTHQIQLDGIKGALFQSVERKLSAENNRIDLLEKTFALLDVKQTLKRGFSISRSQGKTISKNTKLKKGDIIKTEIYGAELESTFSKKNIENE